MALLNVASQAYAQLPKFFETLRAGTAPSTFTRQFLKDIDFKSSNHLSFIPLLKGLGFLTSEGIPTERYRNFLDGSRWQKVLAEAVAEAYSDLFVLKAKPSNADLKMVAGKYKSTYNMSDLQAERAARTFLGLLALCDHDALAPTPHNHVPAPPMNSPAAATIAAPPEPPRAIPVGLHYNIQIHLPATKDVEIYNAIFKSLRDHLID